MDGADDEGNHRFGRVENPTLHFLVPVVNGQERLVEVDDGIFLGHHRGPPAEVLQHGFDVGVPQQGDHLRQAEIVKIHLALPVAADGRQLGEEILEEPVGIGNHGLEVRESEHLSPVHRAENRP